VCTLPYHTSFFPFFDLSLARWCSVVCGLAGLRSFGFCFSVSKKKLPFNLLE
jgi:hypothetical protein